MVDDRCWFGILLALDLALDFFRVLAEGNRAAGWLHFPRSSGVAFAVHGRVASELFSDHPAPYPRHTTNFRPTPIVAPLAVSAGGIS